MWISGGQALEIFLSTANAQLMNLSCTWLWLKIMTVNHCFSRDILFYPQGLMSLIIIINIEYPTFINRWNL